MNCSINDLNPLEYKKANASYLDKSLHSRCLKNTPWPVYMQSQKFSKIPKLDPEQYCHVDSINSKEHGFSDSGGDIAVDGRPYLQAQLLPI